MDPDVVVVDLLGLVDPRVVAGYRHLGFGRRHQVEGVDHVVGAERVAVVEGHALAQCQVQRALVDPGPGSGEQRLDLERVRIAIDQAVHGVLLKDQSRALRVVVGIDVGNGVPPHHPQRIRRLLGMRGGARQRRHRGHQHPR